MTVPGGQFGLPPPGPRPRCWLPSASFKEASGAKTNLCSLPTTINVMVGLKFSWAHASVLASPGKKKRVRDARAEEIRGPVRTSDAGELLLESRFEFTLGDTICRGRFRCLARTQNAETERRYGLLLTAIEQDARGEFAHGLSVPIEEVLECFFFVRSSFALVGVGDCRHVPHTCSPGPR